MKRLVPLLFLLVATARAQFTANPPPPNIIILLADDMGYHDVGFNGCTDVRTPNIDSIAADGVRFTAGYDSAPLCSPSRAGLLTGRYQTRFGHEMNLPPPRATTDKTGLPVSEVLLPTRLKAAGYTSAVIGKWHLGQAPIFVPNNRGFDEFYGFLAGQHSYLHDTDPINPILHNRQPVHHVTYTTYDFADQADQFITANQHHPFFLYLAFNAIHDPWEADAQEFEKLRDIDNAPRRKLASLIASLDLGVGRVLGTLRRLHLDENTLVIFFSDNGGRKGGSDNRPFRGYKYDLYEGGIRVPFAVRWTGHIKPGQTIAEPITSLDLFPTALAVAGLPAPKAPTLDGANLLPLINGEADAFSHRTLFWRYGKWQAVRCGNWKWVRPPGRKPELYDLSRDPSEIHNLAAEEPAVAAHCAQEFARLNRAMVPPLWGQSRTSKASSDQE